MDTYVELTGAGVTTRSAAALTGVPRATATRAAKPAVEPSGTSSIHGIPTVVHADRGTSMTSKSVATLLADLGVTRSHSRPSVSNDNPYSESLFKTMKYAPVFPERFGSISEARAFIDAFATAYNHQHHHTGIGPHTPADVHYGHSYEVDAQHSAALDAARQAHPERFATSTDPKILALPDNAWINQPADDEATAA